MAVAPAPSPNSKAPVAEGSKRKMVSSSGQEEEPRSDMKSGNSSSQPPKRNKSPGVRVIHGRVYDSQNGTTCHQCRQKTCVVSVNCKNQARAKPCTLKYCYTCLLNRYGEKAEDVALLDEWNCPRCRDVCNCSICMKKRGHQPTGMLVQMAKAGGFSSVSDMLHVKGPQSVGPYKRVKETCASPRKLSAPAEILDVRKGQAEAVLRDLIKGRSTRKGKYSLVIQFHIQLLSVIQEETESGSESESESPILDPTHGNDSWLKALKSCIPKSQHILEHVDCTDKRTGGYDNLDSSMKLKLLVLLCDEILGTEKVRNWINEENVKFAEKRKEAKEKLAAAKDKEKILKQKMQDDVAKAIIARDGVPLTMLEHDAIVSKIKNKTAEAHAEMIACKQMIPIDKEKPDAVRTEPIFRDNNGHVYWKLKGFSDAAGVLHQDIGTGDHTAEQVDRWFHYDAEQMDLIEKHIKVSRLRFKRDYKNCGMVSV
ncbi:uncharacterized protein LOC112515558 isoform X2 [Cynara cardunculus var. scolymus]|uniref:uncharacterized protein LOC112515558 isoform X2 n=1 Tax=Cynara cardunculus var. scolymus TaxID=59895 RepID=UPI000D62CE91|nr:uncharacterized protein LOC112515558 isoform X2 [Cynara cardunculus var. scolymus]